MPKTIGNVLDELHELLPDIRYGQFIELVRNKDQELFYLSDEELFIILNNFLECIKK